MNIKIEIAGEKYEIVVTDYGVDENEIYTFGYEVFGFNPDSTPVLLGDQSDDTYADIADAFVAASQHLADIVAWELIEDKSA